MLISEQIKYFHGGNPLARSDNDDVSGQRLDEPFEGSIPPRYRDGLGGIDLEQVKRDQRRARQELVQAMLHRLGKLRGR
ncbi:hypothetical protein FDP08_00890 [Marinobacter panjinensis]|uniref:Uncharacterized protein n=1 Tax=Marinobacter panjinensis TaxID=2576384 RepID=A0A4V6CXB4_9GAMM|nr:hypothetical protein [Marinobacter panjinensis]MCR8915492.1 hypothetical protein [Marinobacter panjinensis]TKV66745.1 hypothetical protein FDP08_00890 [Marinobacter panjinensis]